MPTNPPNAPEVQCPNCGDMVPGLYSHTCDDLDPYGGPATAHCGCFHEGDPKKVRFHVSKDCYCVAKTAGTDG